MKILIVDDSSDSRRILRYIAEQHGHYLTRRLIMEVLKGDIICESTHGKGSVFILRIPVRTQ